MFVSRKRGRFPFWGRAFLAFLVISFLFFRFDTLALSPIERIAASHLFDSSRWEITNFFSKWWHKAGELVTLDRPSQAERIDAIQEYFSLTQEANQVQGERDRRAASGASLSEIQSLEARLGELVRKRNWMRDAVEEALESALSAVLREEGIGLRLGFGGIVFPPVDFRFGHLPQVLVVSPRDKIEKQETVLLEPGLRVEEMEAIEREVLQRHNLSALVEGLGGLSTYPSLIADSRDLRSALHTAAHEWLHQYLFFRPLGQNIRSSSDMETLNETLADIAGRELGDLVYLRLGYSIPPPSDSQAQETQEGGERFDFNKEMHKTRLRVDELLAQGKIEEAETYMEERRQFLAANGYYIRKLNQAYFAFHGTYAESPASISPVDSQLKELRRLVPSLGKFVDMVAGISSYREFLDLLEKLRERGGG